MSGPKFSRMALAAALLEYDNDNVDPREVVDHKRSAMFRQFDAHRAPSIPPLGIDGEDTGDIGDPRSSTGTHREFDPEFQARLSEEATMRDPRHRARTRSVAFSTTGPRSINLESVEDEDYYDGKYEGRDGRYNRPSLESHSRHSQDHAQRALSEAQRIHDMVEGRRSVSAIGALEVHNDMGQPVMVPLPESPPKMVFPPQPGSRPGSMVAMDSPASATFERPLSRAQSALSIGAYSNPPLNQDEHDQEVLRNPFELPAPPPEFGSRFDPKAIEAQRRSIDLPGSRPLSTVSSRHQRAGSTYSAGEVGSFADFSTPRLERRASLVYSDDGQQDAMSFMAPSSSHAADDARRGSRVWGEIPSAAEYGRPLRAPKYTDRVLQIRRRELLRPRTLVMPSVLEGTEKQKHSVHVPEGFTLGEKPLPEDARASVLNLGHGVPLSMAQKTFRSSLMVGGHRENSEYFAGTAAEGEIIAGYADGASDEEEEDMHMRRKPGKLYGTSLIDQLELRKEQMHSKQRTFTGDNRPSMMARQSTLIDPNTLHVPPQAPPVPVQNDSDLLAPRSAQSSLNKRPSTFHDIPALNLPDGDGDSDRQQRVAKSRSVFGTDAVWEREMVKLKGIKEAQSKHDAEEAAKEAEKARLKAGRAEKRKSRWGRKSKMVHPNEAPQFDEDGRPLSMMPGDNRMSTMTGDPRMSRLSMMDPRMTNNDVEELDGQYDDRSITSSDRIPARPPTLSFEPESAVIGSVEPEQPAPPPERRPGSRLGVDDWFQSSDEEDGGSRDRRSATRKPPVTSQPMHDDESSDEEEVPLSRLRRMAVDDDDDSSDEDVPLSRIKAAVVDSDEEVPLSQLKRGALPPLQTGTGDGSLGLALPQRSPPGSPGSRTVSDGAASDATERRSAVSVPAISTPANDNEDDDDEPLLIRQARRSRMVMSPAAGSNRASSNGQDQSVAEIEDDLPLAWKHAGAAQRQHEAKKGAMSPQPAMQHMPSFYGSPYGMPGMPMSGYGMPQMGQMGQMGMMPGPMMGMQGMQGMPMGQPMMPQMMSGMGGMGGMGMPHMGMPGMQMQGMPGMQMQGMPGMPGMPPLEDPGRNIDDWRKQVELAPMPTGSGASVSTRGP